MNLNLLTRESSKHWFSKSLPFKGTTEDHWHGSKNSYLTSTAYGHIIGLIVMRSSTSVNVVELFLSFLVCQQNVKQKKTKLIPKLGLNTKVEIFFNDSHFYPSGFYWGSSMLMDYESQPPACRYPTCRQKMKCKLGV